MARQLKLPPWYLTNKQQCFCCHRCNFRCTGDRPQICGIEIEHYYGTSTITIDPEDFEWSHQSPGDVNRRNVCVSQLFTHTELFCTSRTESDTRSIVCSGGGGCTFTHTNSGTWTGQIYTAVEIRVQLALKRNRTTHASQLGISLQWRHTQHKFLSFSGTKSVTTACPGSTNTVTETFPGITACGDTGYTASGAYLLNSYGLDPFVWYDVDECDDLFTPRAESVTLPFGVFFIDWALLNPFTFPASNCLFTRPLPDPDAWPETPQVSQSTFDFTITPLSC